MKVIYRYPLESTDVLVSAPMGARTLYVAFQAWEPFQLCVWMLVDLEAELALGHFRVVMTGEPISEEFVAGYEYIGTAIAPIGSLVNHVWRER